MGKKQPTTSGAAMAEALQKPPKNPAVGTGSVKVTPSTKVPPSKIGRK